MNVKVAITVLSGVLMLTGCKQDEDTLTTQQTSIVNYLESSHTPRLMSEKEAEESIDENPEYYTSYGNNTYRYVATMYAEGRDTWILVEPGDKVEIYFDAYVFNYSSLANTMPYWSNREETIAALEETGGGLDPEFWKTDPLVLEAGNPDLMEGLRSALTGCREGDSVEVYMTYAAAYGSGIVGLVPKESPVAWLFTIEKVTKN